jgi:hypothetical protein
MADVSATLAAWSNTSANNNPAGNTAVGTGLDDNLREIQGVIVRGLSHKGSDIASAGSTDIGAVEGLFHDITGTTTITGLGTVRAGILKILKFEGALTLTHNATSLILPGGANITTADGDIGIFISEGSGNWRCVSYDRAATTPVQYAAQSEMESGSSTTLAVTPGRQHFHPSACKGWVQATPTGVATVSYNVTSVTDTGSGQATITWGTDISSANYCSLVSIQVDSSDTTTTLIPYVHATSKAAGTTRVEARKLADAALSDPTAWSVAIFGDFA